jgi:polyisoprenyl-phosphate glycosyltransferase
MVIGAIPFVNHDIPAYSKAWGATRTVGSAQGVSAMSLPEPSTQRAPRSGASPRQPLLSIITPAFNEERNLPLLYEHIRAASIAFGLEFEWIIIDDHSRDHTFAVASAITLEDRRVRVIRLARNSGSHNAIFCGFDHAGGDCAAILAADLQDPPETIGLMLAKWRDGAQVVWAVRATAPQTTAIDRQLAGLFYRLIRSWAGLQEMAPTGADMVLLDATVVRALRTFGERNVSIFVLISWIGFRQASITYDKQQRRHGRSGWTIRKKLKLVVDSVTSFTFLPVHFFSGLGIASALLGFLYAAFIVSRAILFASPVEGWSSLMVAVLVIGGLQLLMLGVLGEYVWRSLQEARGRPRYLIEATAGGAGSAATQPALGHEEKREQAL